MSVVWTAVSAVIAVWLVAVAFGALVDGPEPRAVRLGRDGTAAAIPLVGLAVSTLVLGGPGPLPELAAVAVGTVLGYVAIARHGSLPAFGQAMVWGSPWQVASLALAGAVMSVGSVTGSDVVLTAGFVALAGAAGFGIGAFVFGLAARLEAARRFDATQQPILTCPSCHAAVHAGAAWCPRCGDLLPGYCRSCGTLTEAGDSECVRCGLPQLGRLPEATDDEITVRYCQACATRVPVESAYCCACGTVLAPACPVCGTPQTLDAEVCPVCALDLDLAASVVDRGVLEEVIIDVEAEIAEGAEAGAGEPLDAGAR